jgi:hypothetical protein
MVNLVCTQPDKVMAVVRLRHGVVGERRRVCHIVPIPESGPIPHQLRALCSEPILLGDAEVLNRIAGMPCEACLAASIPQHDHEYRALA